MVTPAETQMVSGSALQEGPQMLHFVVPEQRQQKVFVKGGKRQAEESEVIEIKRTYS